MSQMTIEVPADAAVNRLIAVLVEKLNLPRNSPDGQLMSYKFHHRARSRQLLDSETLEGAGVKNTDLLRLGDHYGCRPCSKAARS